MDYPKCLIRSANFWPQLFAPGNEIHRKYLEIPKHCVKSHLDIHTSKSFTYFYIQHFMKKNTISRPCWTVSSMTPCSKRCSSAWAISSNASLLKHGLEICWNTKMWAICNTCVYTVCMFVSIYIFIYIYIYIYIYLVIYLFIVNWAFSVDPCANPNLLIRSEWFCRMGCRLKWLQKHMASAFSSVGSAGGLELAVDGGLLHVDLLDNEMLYIKWECVLWCSLHPIRTPHACF